MIEEEDGEGAELERRAAAAYRQMGGQVQHDVSLAGQQLDLYVELETPDRGLHRVAVKTADWASPLGAGPVAEFAARVNQLRGAGLVDEGVIVAPSAISPEASDAAAAHGLRLVGLADLEAMAAQMQETRPLPPAYTPPAPPDPDVLPEPGALPPGSRLPYGRNERFTGRTKPLLALGRVFLHGPVTAAPPAQVIQGAAGVGKTQLAAAFAHRYGRYFHTVHWVNATQPDQIGAEIAACGAGMDLRRWPERRPDQVARTLEAWQRGGLRLVVLDGLEDLDAARTWLGRLGSGPLRVLVTARRSDWPADLGVELLRLEGFTRQESRTVLRQYVGKERARDAELDRLAERLSHLPLALELAGRYLERTPGLPVPAYLEKLEHLTTHPSTGDWRERIGHSAGPELSVAATFALSWEQVESRAARWLFLLAGHCAPPYPIPRQVLEEALQTQSPGGLRQRLARRLGGTAPMDFRQALNVLTRLGLLQMADDPADPLIHPQLAELASNPIFGKTLLPKVVPALAGTLARLARAANNSMNQTSRPSYFMPLLPHVRHVAEIADAQAPEDAAMLWANLGYHRRRMADYAGARAAHERALAISQRLYGPGNPTVAIHINNLGSVLKDMGDLHGARAAYEQALRVLEGFLLPDHPHIQTVRRNLEGLMERPVDARGPGDKIGGSGPRPARDGPAPAGAKPRR